MKRSTYLLALLTGLFLITSCKKDFEEINKNPNGFTSASDGSLFNGAIVSMKSGWNEQLYVNVSVIYKETQLAALPFVRWNNYTLGTEEIWSTYYKTLPNLRELERRWGTPDTSVHEMMNMVAMERIVRAYLTFKVTDLFGDIPYSQAGYGYQDAERLRPEFDSQRDIYVSLLNDLEWAADHIDPTAITKEPFLTFRRFDNLFNGDMAKWKKFANSLRLRYAMRIVKKIEVDTLAKRTIREIINNFEPTFGVNEFGQLNDDYNESALLYPYQLGYRNESKGWSFNQSKEMRMGTNLWHLVSLHDSTDGSGIFDPRAYYFFDTNNNNKWVAYPNDPPSGLQPDGGIPYEYQRDVAYTLKGNTCLYSPINYYLVRDMDYIPEILITGAEVLFLRAEAYMEGYTGTIDPGQAGTEFLGGLQFSLDFWQHIMSQSKLPLGAPFSRNINVPSNLNFFTVQNSINYFSSTVEEQKRIIYAQEMLDLFWQPQQAFALARRTGKTPHEGAPMNVFRFPIPPTEISYNSTNWSTHYGSSGDLLSTKVWWMN